MNECLDERPTVTLITVRTTGKGQIMIVLGVILIVLGAILDIGILYTIGAVLAVIGVILMLLSASGRAFSGRRFY